MAAPAYRAPRIRVAALALYDGAVITVRHRHGDATYHLLPGGGVGPGETLEEALVREVAEETGLSARVGRPLIINDTIDPHGGRHVINITFEARCEGSITAAPLDPRVEAVDLVAPDALCGLDLRPPLATQILAALDDPHGFQATYAGSLYTPERGV